MKRLITIIALICTACTIYAQEIHENPQRGDCIIGIHLDANSKKDAFDKIISYLTDFDVIVDKADTLTWTISIDKFYSQEPGFAALSWYNYDFVIVEENGDYIAKASGYYEDSKSICMGSFGFASYKEARGVMDGLVRIIKDNFVYTKLDYRPAKFMKNN